MTKRCVICNKKLNEKEIEINDSFCEEHYYLYLEALEMNDFVDLDWEDRDASDI